MMDKDDKNRSPMQILVVRLIALFVILLLLAVSNIILASAGVVLPDSIVSFFKNNLVLLTVMILVFMLGEVFNYLRFPLNLPAPVFNATAAVMLTAFIYNLFDLVEAIIDRKLFTTLRLLSYIIYPLIFSIVFIMGYLTIFSNFRKERDKMQKTKKKKAEKPGEDEDDSIQWEDIGREFRALVYDFIQLMRCTLAEEMERRRKEKDD